MIAAMHAKRVMRVIWVVVVVVVVTEKEMKLKMLG